ncbi:ImpA family type VI secretion system protein [Sphingomonas mucosissima]|uniref:ImpA N-terminal domain-containing protein n=1 Tax=Sphingomonas mucosissima TaxID=370959 RepID=A0A245ZMJ5_9SPHN|nr:type VI secretion system ImpA family N-terminal domain-containing protein [Sphingomonas mucosissima]OWK30955.1 hypothetical protein SPMU_19470 [Sphingomonas mucosissima]
MLRIDHEALLAPVSEDEPAGPDLTYDPGREAIEQAFAASGEEADWDATAGLIINQAARTRDLWLAVYLARAGARGGRLEVVEDGLALLAGYLEQFWGSVHPTLEEYGVEGRKGACESLVRIGEFLAHLRRVPLVEHPRLGRYSGADFELYSAEGASAEGYGQFRAALADTPVDQIEAQVARLDRLRTLVARTDAVLSEQAALAGQTGTNFTSTYEAIDALLAAVRSFAAVEEPVAAVAEIGSGAVVAKSAGISGRIESRGDVARALDAVIEYYGRAEPSSPVPVALGRIKGWITMDFMSILEDIAPGSRSEASSVLRSRAESGSGSDLM